jgi:hypothetical protein
LGQYNGSTDNVVQELVSAIGNGKVAYPPPVFFQEKVYFAAAYDYVKGFQLVKGLFNTKPFATSATALGDLGAGLAFSSGPGGANAIIWAVEGRPHSGLMLAYNALTLEELYDTNMAAGGKDNPGSSVKFSVPTVVNGKVYVGTQTGLVVYGLLAQ